MGKTATRTTLSTEITFETYDNADFAPVLRETTSRFFIDNDGRETKHTSRRVLRAEGASHADYCKALVLALARYGTLMELPYIIDGVSGVGMMGERICLDCRVRWIERDKVLRSDESCPNGHSGGVVFSGVESFHADAETWYVSLTDDNSPGKVSFRRGRDGYPAFRELVLPLNFRVYDSAAVASIREMYRSDSKPKQVTVDSDLMIQGELGELDEA